MYISYYISVDTNSLYFSCVYCITVSLCVAPWAVFIWNRVPQMREISEMDKFNIMIVFFVATMFFLAVSGLWVFHAFLTAKNKSTLEMGRSPRFKDEACPSSNPYDIGCKGNCAEVYGTGPLIICPLYTTHGNGVLFPRDRADRSSSDMHRLLGGTGINSEEEEEEEDIIYNTDIPLQLEPVARA